MDLRDMSFPSVGCQNRHQGISCPVKQFLEFIKHKNDFLHDFKTFKIAISMAINKINIKHLTYMGKYLAVSLR